ncbi:NAD(P)-dependent oxidoreductase [Amaricoccus sp.]|uniref:NAD(P)-dependent oxidoreductase n=1 Tax=Amaricoccus sp. TaxID=1872485 RepID=UPI00262F1042|nr:NAD(P)-dependent oxidoreductase [Amaricoccus sp.]HRO12627.1 NAD(P)-dependent oxidoreductase [Amaricoccus sp.]
MAPSPHSPGIVSGRLSREALAENFADIAPNFTAHEALVAADRCYFCYDAPCTLACPTSIDVPLFIRQIASGVPEAAAMTILSQNVLGGMCARVCPTETLCEEACVREAAEGRPVEIGRLQRYATDALMARGGQPFARAASSGRRVAVVGAGPAGLACAHRLAMLGHEVVLLDGREKAGGLNEFGIAAYKAVDGFAQAEVEWLLGIGGISLRQGVRLGRDLTLDALLADFDAVFLGIGLGGVRGLAGAESGGPEVRPAVDFIAELRQARDLAALPVGRRVVVIGGGMTAIDAGVQAKKLGAEEVTIAYRRGRGRMAASRYEQELAASVGVRILANAAPVGTVPAGMVFARSDEEGVPGEERFEIAADQVLTAIGQVLGPVPEGLAVAGGKIAVTGPGRTSLARVWAGGDCAAGGDDLTVTAVAEGRDAAIDIHAALMAA